MKLLSKILTASMILAGSFLGLNNQVEASTKDCNKIGVNAGLRYKKTEEPVNATILAHQYADGFDWRNSKACELYPNGEYTKKELEDIVTAQAHAHNTTVPIEVRPTKPGLYKYMSGNITWFQDKQ